MPCSDAFKSISTGLRECNTGDRYLSVSRKDGPSGFNATAAITTVTWDKISVITLFTAVLNTIAAATLRAVGTTSGVGGGGIDRTQIAFFARIRFAVAAEQQDELTGLVA